MSTLRGLFDVHDDDPPTMRRNTLAAFGTLFAVTTGHTLLETARDTLFLAKMPASRLPWMNLIIVVCALVLSRLSSRGARADSKAGIALTLVVASAVTAAFWFLMPAIGAPPPIALYGLYVWSGLFASWVTVQFWTLLGRIYHVGQAKRLYGFIGAGAVLGAVVGAVLARFAMGIFAPRTSLLLGAGLFVVAVLPTLAVVVKEEAAAPTRAPPKADPRAPMTAGFGLLWENAFARRVLAIGLLAVMTVGVGDYLFKAQIASRYVDPAELGQVLSTFYAITNAFSLVAQLFVAPWLFRSQGVQRALFVFPGLMAIAAGTVLATGGAIFAAILLKVVDGTLRYSVHRTTMELLLVPVPDGTRERIKPIIELIGSRGGQALASIGILLLVAIGVAKPLVLGAIVLALAVGWFSLVVTIRALYLDVFRETLKSGGLSGKAELPELDLGALETIFTGLNSSNDGTVLASLDLLADQRRERLIPALILYHPSRDVVLRSLEIFTRLGRNDFVSIADRLNAHPDRDIAAAALRARTTVAPDKAVLLSRLDDECAQVSVTALIALMAREWISEGDAEKRLEAACSLGTGAEISRTIRDVARARPDGRRGRFDDRFDDMLIEIAELTEAPDAAALAVETEASKDRDPGFLGVPREIAIRLEAAQAMGARKSPRFLPPLIRMLARHELRATARAALVEIPGALDALEAALADEKVPREVRFHIPRTICVFEPTEAARRLTAHLADEKDGAVRFKMLRGLIKLRRRDKALSLDDGILAKAADGTMDHIAELHRWSTALAAGTDEPPSSSLADPLHAAHHLLVDLVRDKEVHATQRLFLLLELMYREDLDDVWRGLRSKNGKTRASSLELLENILPPATRTRVLALVGDGPRPTTALAYEATLREILARGGSTMRTLAEVRAAELGIEAGPSRATDPNGLLVAARRGLLDRARELLVSQPGGATRAPA